jgi:hypothetical protein
MKKWNDKFYPLMKENAAAFVDAAIIELEPIFQQYVCPKAVRGDERLKNPTTSNPSDYNPDSDIIEDIESGKTKTIIYAQSKTGFQDRFDIRCCAVAQSGNYPSVRSIMTFWKNGNLTISN